MANGEAIDSTGTFASVKEYYGQDLRSTKDLKTSACTAGDKPHSSVFEILGSVPQEVTDKFYGCGAPLPLGITNLRVRSLELS